MKRNAWFAGTIALAALAVDAGAASGQVETLLYDTHRKVTNLNNSLDGAVKKLDQTTTDLISRVDASEEQTRRLRSMVEENQVKLDTLEQQLGELTATIYRQFNLTTSGSGYSAPAGGSTLPGTGVAIEPPEPTTSLEPTDRTDEVEVPEPNVIDTDGSQADYQQAQIVWQSGNYDEALRLFSDFLAQNPGSERAGNAQYWKGRCLLKLERYQESIDTFELLRAEYPENHTKNSQAMQSQAVALSRLGRNDEAENLLREVITKYPTSTAARQAESDLAKLSGN